MGRWSQYDTDEERLPEGMVRIGYDADDQTYTFRDTSDGSIWESAPGNQYGRLTRISGPSQQASHGFDDDDDDDNEHPPPYTVHEPEVSWRHEMMPLFNFFLIIGLILLGVFWWLSKADSSSPREAPVTTCGINADVYTIKAGNTCWAISQEKGVSLGALVNENKNINCDRLAVGATMCIPKKT